MSRISKGAYNGGTATDSVMRRQRTTGARHKPPPRSQNPRNRSVYPMTTIMYAQQIVSAHASPPRVCNPWMILSTQLSIRVCLLVASQVTLACFTVYRSITAPFTGGALVRYHLYLVLLATVMPLVFYAEIIAPWWRTWQIVRSGHASIAAVLTVKRHIVYYREVVEGTWRVAGAHGHDTLPFRLSYDELGG